VLTAIAGVDELAFRWFPLLAKHLCSLLPPPPACFGLLGLLPPVRFSLTAPSRRAVRPVRSVKSRTTLLAVLLTSAESDAGRADGHFTALLHARDFVFARNAASPTVHDPEQELARLGQQLAETESLRAAADAKVKAVQAQAAELEAELARLKKLLASPTPYDVGQQREIRDAIDKAAGQLDDTRAAEAALAKGRPDLPATADTYVPNDIQGGRPRHRRPP
jgi:hypothetical protein